ncbi:MAG: DapH/DapD/GlmU-related protein [Nakamurella sp.]
MIESSLVTDGATGIGLATIAVDGSVLDTWYPAGAFALGANSVIPIDEIDGEASNLTANATESLAASLNASLAGLLKAAERTDSIRGVTIQRIRTVIASLADAPATVPDAYLRLHLLSARFVVPNSINIDGIFGVLPNNAWTSLGPVSPDDVSAVMLRARTAGTALEVHGVDRFPRMTDYVVPTGVRVADGNRVRLGAYLSPGTVVMHEGFCNFNAGTLGTSMVEGRISQGVVVGDGSDIGGGASTMGTLSGGGAVRVSLGKRCLIGANAGVGIPLGDDCIIEAGLYLTAGTKVALLADGQRTVVAARALAGASGLLFRRHSLTGEVQAVPHTGTWNGLNAALHAAD